MHQTTAEFLRKSRGAFLTGAPLSLQEIRDRVSSHAGGTDRRDTLSALDTLARILARDLSTVRADPATVRALFAARTAAELGLSDKRFANVCRFRRKPATCSDLMSAIVPI